MPELSPYIPEQPEEYEAVEAAEITSGDFDDDMHLADGEASVAMEDEPDETDEPDELDRIRQVVAAGIPSDMSYEDLFELQKPLTEKIHALYDELGAQLQTEYRVSYKDEAIDWYHACDHAPEYNEYIEKVIEIALQRCSPSERPQVDALSQQLRDTAEAVTPVYMALGQLQRPSYERIRDTARNSTDWEAVVGKYVTREAYTDTHFEEVIRYLSERGVALSFPGEIEYEKEIIRSFSKETQQAGDVATSDGPAPRLGSPAVEAQSLKEQLAFNKETYRVLFSTSFDRIRPLRGEFLTTRFVASTALCQEVDYTGERILPSPIARAITTVTERCRRNLEAVDTEHVMATRALPSARLEIGNLELAQNILKDIEDGDIERWITTDIWKHMPMRALTSVKTIIFTDKPNPTMPNTPAWYSRETDNIHIFIGSREAPITSHVQYALHHEPYHNAQANVVTIAETKAFNRTLKDVGRLVKPLAPVSHKTAPVHIWLREEFAQSGVRYNQQPGYLLRGGLPRFAAFNDIFQSFPAWGRVRWLAWAKDHDIDLRKPYKEIRTPLEIAMNSLRRPNRSW